MLVLFIIWATGAFFFYMFLLGEGKWTSSGFQFKYTTGQAAFYAITWCVWLGSMGTRLLLGALVLFLVFLAELWKKLRR